MDTRLDGTHRVLRMIFFSCAEYSARCAQVPDPAGAQEAQDTEVIRAGNRGQVSEVLPLFILPSCMEHGTKSASDKRWPS